MPEMEKPVGFESILAQEYRTLRPDQPFPSKGREQLYAAAHEQPQPFSALCVSGGGIRSATFALGAIQGLAEHGLLEQFDYLSTVSGGGYIGAWLTAWVNRVKGLANVVPHLRRDAPPPARGEADPIQHLREYNNYLSPKLGAFSGDTWTLASTIARNIFLNWLVLIPLFMSILIAPRMLLSLVRYSEFYKEMHGTASPVSQSLFVADFIPAAAALLFGYSLFSTLRYLPGVGNKDHTSAAFVWNVLAPLIASTLLFCAYDSLYFFDSLDVPTPFTSVLAWTCIPCISAWLLYVICFGKSFSHRIQLLLGPLSLAILLLGLGTGAAAWVLTNQFFDSTTWSQYVTVGPPLLLVSFAVAGAIFVGLSSTALKDEDREWLARAAARLLLFCLIWMAACAVVLLIPKFAFGWPVWGQSALAAAGAISAWGSSFAGFKGSKTMPSQGETRPKSPLSGIALKLGPPLFIALLAIGLAVLTNWLMFSTSSIPLAKIWWNHDDLLVHTTWGANLVWAAWFFALSWVMARYININKFSLEGMYRDRLIRAYLGASNPKRTANKFTGFSQTDNIFMHQLDTTLKPFHVVNMTLNLVDGDRLAWQQRKAESFTATALHCGNSRLGYRPSRHYAGRTGISLGTAVTISGAAASPNMGYHSSPVVGFIMTLFNVRLGVWLGNPGTAGNKTWKQEGPRSAITSLLKEALGLTTDRSEYVYLSDGGHFENLGLYEMVLRRCRHIVLLDSGCDATFTYEDLANALRKIRIDLKIPITFADDVKKRCRIAKIHYSAVDGACQDGELIYIKPMMLGSEPPDVMSYHSSHPEFPHQSTAEQWFDESQTESYRMLGLTTIDDICAGWKGGTLASFPKHVAQTYLGSTPSTALARTAEA
jgi:hypothetical protein